MRWLLLVFFAAVTAVFSAGCSSNNSNPTTPTAHPTPTPVFTYPYFTYFGSYGVSGNNAYFEGPEGIAIGEGFIAVADRAYGNVQVFDNIGTYLYSIAANVPYGMAIARDKNGAVELYVANYGNGEVDSTLLTHSGQTAGYFWNANFTTTHPTDVKINSNGDLVIADFGTGKIYTTAWTNDHILATSHGASVTSPGGLVLDSSNNVYSTDYYSGQVLYWNSSLSYLGAFSGSAWTTALYRPMGIALDLENRLVIVDYGNSRVVRADTSGNYLQEIGHGDFSSPAYAALDAAGDLFVTDYNYCEVIEYTPQ